MPRQILLFPVSRFSIALLLASLALISISCTSVAGSGGGPSGQVVLASPSASSERPGPRAQMLSRRGERAYRQENYKAAERFFREALRLAPGALHALTGMGWTLYDDGRPKEALPFFLKSQKLHPRDGSARRGLGYLYYRRGDKEKAKQMLGALDKDKWPELANIDIELQKIKAPPPARAKSAAPAVSSKKEKAASPPQKAVLQKEAVQKPAVQKAVLRKVVKLPPVRRLSFANMVRVPGGRYEMGIVVAPLEKKTKRRKRKRRLEPKAPKKTSVSVFVKPFRLDRFEVTNAMYARFVLETNRAPPPFWRKPHFRGAHIPVVGTSWHDARAYCAWAGKRLPTEKEWEFAAKGGAMGRPYPWGRVLEDRNAVYGLPPDRGGPKAVGRRPGGASPYGAEDMAGNVWEWVEDVFRARYEDSRPVVRGGQTYRTLRGGSWVNSSRALKTIARTGDVPGRRLPVYGFRCAANIP